MPTNDITKLLKLEGINFESSEEKEEYTLLNFTRKDERPNCPRCGRCFLQEKNAQSCKEKYTILQEKVHKKCVFFY